MHAGIWYCTRGIDLHNVYWAHSIWFLLADPSMTNHNQVQPPVLPRPDVNVGIKYRRIPLIQLEEICTVTQESY